IFLFMAGAPSHLELFDYKPELAKWDGKLPPAELLKGYRAAFINPSSKLLGPKFKFAKHGQSGAELSELLPHLAGVVDDIAIVKSMVTDAFNHAPAQIFALTGSQQFGRPSAGAWVTYGLGSASRDLPGFVVFSSGSKGLSGGNSCRGAGLLATARDLMDLSKESPKTLAMYGAEPGKPSFANNCLLARRLVERGVRFVQLFHEAWDHHGGLVSGLKAECKKTDQASAALVKDL